MFERLPITSQLIHVLFPSTINLDVLMNYNKGYYCTETIVTLSMDGHNENRSIPQYDCKPFVVVKKIIKRAL